MAFEWDDIQARFVKKKLTGHAARFEIKVQVAGSALEIDAVAESPSAVEFFDFFTRLTLIENKAPSVTFSEKDVCRCTGRAFLFAETQSHPLCALSEITQVFLCSRATATVRQKLDWQQIRPGVLESMKFIRMVLVQANELEVEEKSLELLVHFASEPKLREVIEYIVDRNVERLYTTVWMLHRETFKEVLAMKGKSVEGLVVDVAGAIEEYGLSRVIEELGLGRVIDEVGLGRVIDEVGLGRVIDEVGADRIIAELGLSRGIAETRLKEMIRQIGTEEVRRALESVENEQP